MDFLDGMDLRPVLGVLGMFVFILSFLLVTMRAGRKDQG